MIYEFEKSILDFDPAICFTMLENDQTPLAEDYRTVYEPRGYTVNNEADAMEESSVCALSFFSGAGGMDIGTQLAGAKIISSLDFDRDSIETLRRNRYFANTEHILKDIRETTAKDFKSVIKKHKPHKLILTGGPPCQPFSKAGYWVTHEKRKGSADPRNMIGQYLRLIGELRPDGFILENVESLTHPKNFHAVEELENEIGRLGYNLIRVKANAVDYGVPQKRKRIFFIASLKKLKTTPVPTHGTGAGKIPYERVLDWIGKYDSDAYAEPEERTVNKTFADELRAIPPGKNYLALTAKAGYPDPKFEANKRFWSFLLKLHPFHPSWTIAAQPGPWVGPFHWNNRRLRVPEIAAIQTFPEDYEFVGSRRSVQKQIGNAVPPLLARAMTEHLLKYL